MKKTIVIGIGAIIGATIGLATKELKPEVIVAITGIIVTPFFLIEARHHSFGEETLHLSVGALIGALIGALSVPSSAGITGTVVETGLVAEILQLIRIHARPGFIGTIAGTGLVAMVKPVIEKVKVRD